MSREYRMDKEYSFIEIVRYNLRMWWLAVIMAVICAAVLGGYKYVSLRPYVENAQYQDMQQVEASLFVSDYSDGSVVERVGNVMSIAKSSRAYDSFCKQAGSSMTLNEYSGLFEVMQGEASGVASVYVTFPVTVGETSILTEEEAVKFANDVLRATQDVCEEIIGKDCVTILDEPHAIYEVVKLQTYSITEDEFEKGVLKAITAGILLGVIVEVVLFTFWMLIYKKPKNAEEVRACLDTNVIDVLKDGTDNEEAFKKVALYLKDDAVSCNKISCLPIKSAKKDVALKLAMSYANEQKKTLFVDLGATEGAGIETGSISEYVLGESTEVKPVSMHSYLDSLCRNHNAEKGLDIAGNKRFGLLIEDMSKKYECIVINSPDVTKSAEAYAASKLCDKTFVVCGRKSVNNETLYRTKNTAEVNNIHLDGVLIYEL